jgi:hypothetical protein
MNKIILLLEKDFIFCSKNLRMLTMVFFSFAFSFYAFFKIDPIYKEYVIALASLWILSTASLELLIYRDIIKNRVSHILAFGFDIFDFMISKIIFITLFSVMSSFLFVVFFRILRIICRYNYPSLSSWSFPVLIPIVFFIISLSTFLTFKYQVSRPIRIVFILILLLISELREFIIAISRLGFAYIGLFVFFTIADIIIIKFLRNFKNENVL